MACQLPTKAFVGTNPEDARKAYEWVAIGKQCPVSISRMASFMTGGRVHLPRPFDLHHRARARSRELVGFGETTLSVGYHPISMSLIG